MVERINRLIQGFNYAFVELPDPRTKDWLFVAKPYQILCLVFVYLMFVLKWGPKWMNNRTAFKLDKILMAYNAMQIVSCAYLVVEGVRLAWGWDYKWVCEPVDYSYSPKPLNIARLTYFYYIMKIIDLLDTVFFVLRKKFNQVTFLHLYHHAGMVLLIWGGVTYFPGGHGTLIGVINSFVHTIMYSYYLLTVINPKYKESCWWKKHITQLQIVQFFWCVVHMATIIFKPDCEYPRWTSAIFIPQDLFMLVLFLDFYIKTYIRKPTLKVTISNDSNSTECLNNSVESSVEDNTNIGEQVLNNGFENNLGDEDENLGIISEIDATLNDKYLSEENDEKYYIHFNRSRFYANHESYKEIKKIE